MSINTVQSTTPFDQIARQLVDRFDANKDGQLTTEEFTSFLSNFLTSTVGRTPPTARPMAWWPAPAPTA